MQPPAKLIPIFPSEKLYELVLALVLFLFLPFVFALGHGLSFLVDLVDCSPL